MEHLNESPTRARVENVSWSPINCDLLTSNYKVSSESLVKDELVSPKNLSKTDVSKINSINLIRNKFDLLMNIIKNETDISIILETKIDSSFPISQFTMMCNLIPLRLNQTIRGVEHFCLSGKIFLVKQLKLTAMLILRSFLWK